MLFNLFEDGAIFYSETRRGVFLIEDAFVAIYFYFIKTYLNWTLLDDLIDCLFCATKGEVIVYYFYFSKLESISEIYYLGGAWGFLILFGVGFFDFFLEEEAVYLITARFSSKDTEDNDYFLV